MIASHATKPSQSGWSTCLLTALITAVDNVRQVTAANRTSLPPTMQSIVIPRRASNESSRWLAGAGDRDAIGSGLRLGASRGMVDNSIADCGISPSSSRIPVSSCSTRYLAT